MRNTENELNKTEWYLKGNILKNTKHIKGIKSTWGMISNVFSSPNSNVYLFIF